MPSMISTMSRKVLIYLNKHGFGELSLTIYIMDNSASLEEVVALEQHFIDNTKPNLNVDLVASNYGYHEPMAIETLEKLRKLRGSPVYVYDAFGLGLLHVFDSKQHMYNSINIHHKTLEKCLDSAALYLDKFFFYLDLIEETNNTNILDIKHLITLVSERRIIYMVKHPASKAIIAEYKDDSNKNLIFDSLQSLSKDLKGDRKVIRQYLKGTKQGYYRGK